MVVTPPPSGAANLEAQNLTKRYGRKPVVEDVSFAVHPGEVYALTGPNGSGKTTLIRLLTGLAFPTKGTVRMMGYDLYAGGHAARKVLGAVVEAPAAFYPHLSGRQNLEMHAYLTSLQGAEERIRQMLTRVELLAVADQPVRTYSLGQRQRLGLAAAILHDPQVLILDEPTSGMDPQGIGMVHEILAERAAHGVAVLLSSHHLREVSAYAHKVGILGGGRLLEEVVLNFQGARFRVMVDRPEQALAFVRTLPMVKNASLRNQMVVFAGPPDAVVSALVRENHKISTLEADYFDLYEYYRERLRGV
jgi:ABC-2 type transport system ATP-binding protein